MVNLVINFPNEEAKSEFLELLNDNFDPYDVFYESSIGYDIDTDSTEDEFTFIFNEFEEDDDEWEEEEYEDDEEDEDIDGGNEYTVD